MFEQIRATLAKQLRISEDKITPDSKIKEDLGADSLDVLELLMEIEDKFNITIPEEELVNFVTIKNIADYLDSHVK